MSYAEITARLARAVRSLAEGHGLLALVFWVLAATFAAALVASCGGAAGYAADPACYDLDPPADRTGLISRDEVEGKIMGWLASGPAPGGASAVEIEGVTASCLTTFEDYTGRFYQPGEFSSTPPDTPVWVVEVKGESRSLRGDSVTWRYSMGVIHAETGDSIEGARYFEPLLAPAVRDGS